MSRFLFTLRSLVVAVVFALPSSAAWAYRPFISTDAAVADPREVEIELGYFDLKRTRRENTFIIPKLVLNYGLLRDVEIVGEFRVERDPTAHWNVVDPGLSIKAVLREGILQEKEGISFAVEAGPLLPSTVQGERKFGFEGIGILSGQLAMLTYHINFGGGVARSNSNPFVVWGTIFELPVVPKFRLVSEINGESVQSERANNSALLGFIWQPTSSNLFVDAGVRRSIGRGAPDWQFTTGLTFGFSLPAFGNP
jgi:hypothetical protein